MSEPISAAEAVEVRDGIQTPVPGLQCEYRFGGRLLILTASVSPTREIADAWAEELRRYIERQKSPRRFLVYDGTQANLINLSPYARQRLTEVARSNPDAYGRVAVILPQLGALQALIQYFLQLNHHRFQPKLDIRLFHDLDSGLEWVMDGLAEGV